MFCLISTGTRWYLATIRYLNYGQPVVIALLRAWFGYGFYKAGMGKLQNFDNTVGYFASLGIPLPELNVVMAGTTECVGGVLLLSGACSRAIAVPLIFTMLVAYSTQHLDEFRTLWTIRPGATYNPVPFFKAAPFLYLLTSFLVLTFGPGVFSIDYFLKKHLDRREHVRCNHEPA
ncbi:MAG TPA: DoxX family protein [Planctomycetaceae bacterium]|jgi:putative oxidoreductase